MSGGLCQPWGTNYSAGVVKSIPDLWTESEFDWQRPVVLPTLPVAWGKRRGSVPPVVPDKQRRDRLAFAIRAAMGQRSAQSIAEAMEPKRSKETVARWARGETWRRRHRKLNRIWTL